MRCLVLKTTVNRSVPEVINEALHPRVIRVQAVLVSKRCIETGVDEMAEFMEKQVNQSVIKWSVI